MGAPSQVLHFALQVVLDRLKVIAGATAEPGETDWMFLTSPGVPDLVLFQKIEQNWPAIVGSETMHFAVIYCRMGPNAGVWLHHLRTPLDRTEYDFGVHQIQWG